MLRYQTIIPIDQGAINNIIRCSVENTPFHIINRELFKCIKDKNSVFNIVRIDGITYTGFCYAVLGNGVSYGKVAFLYDKTTSL